MMRKERKKHTKIIEIVQVSPGSHFVVRLAGFYRVLARPVSLAAALETANRIGEKLFGRLGLEYRVSY